MSGRSTKYRWRQPTTHASAPVGVPDTDKSAALTTATSAHHGNKSSRANELIKVRVRFRRTRITLVATITLCLGTVLSHFPKAISVLPDVSGRGGTGYISAASFRTKRKKRKKKKRKGFQRNMVSLERGRAGRAAGYISGTYTVSILVKKAWQHRDVLRSASSSKTLNRNSRRPFTSSHSGC